MTQKRLITFAALCSAVLLAAAFASQASGWAPCKMCLWQRWPHAVALVIGAVAFLAGGRFATAFAGLGTLTILVGVGIAGYHSGVERKWWPGPSSCTGVGQDLGALSAEQLLPGASDTPPLVLCDQFTPFLFGLSMPNWNLLASLVVAGIWILALTRASGSRAATTSRSM